MFVPIHYMPRYKRPWMQRTQLYKQHIACTEFSVAGTKLQQILLLMNVSIQDTTMLATTDCHCCVGTKYQWNCTVCHRWALSGDSKVNRVTWKHAMTTKKVRVMQCEECSNQQAGMQMDNARRSAMLSSSVLWWVPPQREWFNFVYNVTEHRSCFRASQYSYAANKGYMVVVPLVWH